MRTLNEEYIAFSENIYRNYVLKISVGRTLPDGTAQLVTILNQNQIMSMKIINGSTTGGFSIGQSVCKTLELTVLKTKQIRVRDGLKVEISFIDPHTTVNSGFVTIGAFYVDSVVNNGRYLKITALDKMIMLEKIYKSKLNYPAKVSDIINEIISPYDMQLDSDDMIKNDAVIKTAPIKGVSDFKNIKIHFTKREMLGLLAGLNGGNAFITPENKLKFSTPYNTHTTILPEKVISEQLADAKILINKIILNKDGHSNSTSEDWENGEIELFCPLEFENEVSAVNALKSQLVGKTFEAVVIQCQGRGIYELGDMLDYKDMENETDRMLIIGIVYDFSDGFFSETLYSLAQSESQRDYAGNENISPDISPGGYGGEKTNDSSVVEPALEAAYTDDSTVAEQEVQEFE